VKIVLFGIFLAIALLVIAAKSLVVAKEDECLVIFRLGRLFDVYGPGRSVIIPFCDRVVRINVETVPGWPNLSESEFRERAAQMAIQRETQR
jgi:regulator of protease activity HflC (stomatin/prohibitin superfamily)